MRTPRIAPALLAGLLAAACQPAPERPEAPAPVAEGGPASATPASGAGPTAPSAESLTLADLPEATAELATLQELVARALLETEGERKAVEALGSLDRRMSRTATRLDQLPYDELTETARQLDIGSRTVAAASAQVTGRLRDLEAASRRIAALSARFAKLAQLAEAADAPDSMRARTEGARTELQELAARIATRRKKVLGAVDTLSDVRGRLAGLRARVDTLREAARHDVAAQEEAPIWALPRDGAASLDAALARLERDGRRLGTYLRAEGLRLVVLAIAILGGTLTLLHRLRRPAERRAEVDPIARATVRIMETPMASALPIVVLGLILLMPAAPRLAYDLCWLAATPCAAWVVVRVLGPAVRRTVWVVAPVLSLVPLARPLEAFPLADRLYLVLQALAVGCALALDLVQHRWDEVVPSPRGRRALGVLAWALVAALAVSAVASIGGAVGLARLLLVGGLATLGSAVVLASSFLVLAGLWGAFLASRRVHALRSVSLHEEALVHGGRKGLRLVGVAWWLWTVLASFHATAPVRSWFASVVSAHLTLGSASFSIGSILTFALVFGIAWSLARLLVFVLDEELLPRLDLARGAAAAVSLTTRYLVLLVGFLLASAAAGIDLGKMGFLAGALGVGVGFGLQNVVNNFVSGLILLFERPVQVGDAVEVSGTTGQVKRIGIRASTVRTFDGAEVIVPNGDLISKAVTNWTLSDPNRRFDVPVGVAYGSGLETTAQALLAAARRTPGVLPAPPPQALFSGFGDSSLDWLLRVWIRIDDSPVVLSELRRAMTDELGKEGIEIPFPQRDLHLVSVSPAARGALGPTGAAEE